MKDHVVGDQVAVDMGPNLPSPRPRLADQKQRIYYFDRCYDLETHYPDQTVNTAETFAIFAAVRERYLILLYH